MTTVSWVARAALAAAIGVLTGGCGGEATGRPGEVATKPSEDTTLVSSLGWSVRDSTPYARTQHSGVIDTSRDRLLLLGGVANDMWQLPLSGERANEWSQIIAAGERPPGGYANVVYDERGDRVLALFTRHEAGAFRGELWMLSLGETPTWQRVVAEGPDPEAELVGGRIIVQDGTLLALGTGGTWSLDLRSMVWARLSDAPERPFRAAALFTGWGGEAFVLDAPRLRLVALLDGVEVWEMPLTSRTWAPLGRTTYVSMPGLFDEARGELHFPGPQSQTFSLATNQWHVELDDTFPPDLGLASATVDAKRRRAIYVAGPSATTPDALSDYRGSDTWQLSLDSFARQVLVPNERGAIHDARSVWDPLRKAVISLRPHGHLPGPTVARSLAAGATWQELEVAAAPLGFGAALVYDSDAAAVFGFGGLADTERASNALARLPAAPGSQWQPLTTAHGPAPRREALVVYDSVQRQLVVRGGNTGLLAGETLDDVWTFSTATSSWSQLEPQGEAPGPRNNEMGVYDPVGQRLIVWGGALGEFGKQRFEDLHALSLDEAPTWTELNPVGELPLVGFGPRYALYDPQGQRMIAMVQDGHELLVYALSLDETPTWHRFCSVGVAPDPGAPHGQPLLTDDGIFLAVANGAFKFDLETPYCG